MRSLEGALHTQNKMKSTRPLNRCLRVAAAVTAGIIAASIATGASASSENTIAPAAVAPLKYDVSPAAKRRVMPVYPYEQLIEGHSGWANASFVIDYSGRPLFANPEGASNRAFGKAVVAMIEASEYSPGKRGKHAVMSPSHEEYQFFEEKLDDGARRVLKELRRGGTTLPQVSQLDERPKAVRQASPVYPRALKDDGLTGQAEIEFVIDREGRVLFPRIVSASHEDFGWAAATAVAQWRFQAPQRHGEKVDAVMRVPVLFDANQLASAD